MSSKNVPIYLDNHATTPADPAVVAAMQPWWSEGFGNASSGDHAFGWAAAAAIDQARSDIAALIGADATEIVLTSGATEANNIALLGAARGHDGDRDHIVISAVEHKCVLEAAHYLGCNGWRVDVAPVDSEGIICLDVFETLLTDRTLIASVMAVNNEIGTVQPIEAIGALCERTGTLLHCDAAQAPCARRIDVNELKVSLLSLSGHKIYGPKGIGALFVRTDVLPVLAPIQFGGGQEQGLRSGTLPTPLCVGFGKACELVIANRDADATRTVGYRNTLWQSLRQAAPSARINGTVVARHPGNLNVMFPGIDAAELIGQLQPHVAASTGSACTTGIPHPSHVLEAIGLQPAEAEASIRFGIGRFTTENDIERAIGLISDALKRTSRSAA